MDKLVPKERVLADVLGGASDTTLYRLEKQDRNFPQRVYVRRRAFWLESELEEWLDQQKAKRPAHSPTEI